MIDHDGSLGQIESTDVAPSNRVRELLGQHGDPVVKVRQDGLNLSVPVAWCVERNAAGGTSAMAFGTAVAPESMIVRIVSAVATAVPAAIPQR